MSPNHRSAESKISVDRKRPIQGLLRLHTRYGPPDRSAALRRPLSRGSNPCSCPHEPLVSYRINRQLSVWNLPPLVMRAFGAHCHAPTSCAIHSITSSARPSTVGGTSRPLVLQVLRLCERDGQIGRLRTLTLACASIFPRVPWLAGLR